MEYQVRITRLIAVLLPLLLAPFAITASSEVETEAHNVRVDWKDAIAVSKTDTSLQVVVTPQLLRRSRLHDGAFHALRSLGADYVRYVPWLPYPKQAVAELEPPTPDKTSWDFTHIDPTLEDFMRATEGHSVVMNFSTIPAWMYRTKTPVVYPDDPNQVFWTYTQGTVLRDPTMREPAEYLARILSWYEKGGFTDENGKWHESGHHYKFAYWEILNEIESEHHWTVEEYTRFYDQAVLAMRKVDPEIRFVGMALARPRTPRFFEYFLNPTNHQPGIPLDFISYHFYAHPAASETLQNWQYSFFDQSTGFINTVRYIDSIRQRLSPKTAVMLNELGVILPEDDKEKTAGYVAKDEPAMYWNLNGAMFAYMYQEFAKLGIEVVSESQLVGYKSQYPSVSMVNYNTGNGNARYWVLKLLKDSFHVGDTLVDTTMDHKDDDIAVQAFITQRKKKLLVINKRLSSATLVLPSEFVGGTISYVAPSTGETSLGSASLRNTRIVLEPAEVAVVTVNQE